MFHFYTLPASLCLENFWHLKKYVLAWKVQKLLMESYNYLILDLGKRNCQAKNNSIQRKFI